MAILDKPICCGVPMHKAGLSESKHQRYRCRMCTFRTTGNDDGALGYDPELTKSNTQTLQAAIKAGAKRFIITSAQNNTRVNADFLTALERYSRKWSCPLVVIPVSYKNPSAFTGGQEFKKTWHSSVEPYLVDDNVHLGGGVEIAADTKIAATAVNPISGMHTVGGHRWQIIGHAQVAMEPVGAPAGVRPKRVYSTGSVTHRNYSRSKIGKIAEFHHTACALVVEVSGTQAFVRQLAWGNGCFYDLAGGQLLKYTPEKVTNGERALALTTGDEHVRFHDKAVRRATYATGGIAEVVKPAHLVRHDVLDGYAGSHHHRHDPLTQFKKRANGGDCYRAELDQVVDFINDTTPKGAVNIMVDSNHHDHLQQFLNKADANVDHTNAVFIAEMQAKQRRAVLAGEDHRPLMLFCDGKVTAPIKWLGRSKPFVIKGVDYSQHGDVGVNGSRGSAAGLAKTTYKMTIGHSHTPRICKGVYQVGKSATRLEYEKGLQTQGQTHCVQYANGKRTLVDIFAGKWRA